MRHLLFLFSIIISQFTIGQTGNVEIIKDARIDVLVKKQGLIVPPATSPQISGYRVQLAFDSDKKLIEELRTKFTLSFPNEGCYIEFKAPNFFLKAGDYRTQLEAEKMKDAIVREFPSSFIIKEMINLPKIPKD
jgi:hypothetical protein